MGYRVGGGGSRNTDLMSGFPEVWGCQAPAHLMGTCLACPGDQGFIGRSASVPSSLFAEKEEEERRRCWTKEQKGTGFGQSGRKFYGKWGRIK